MIIRVMLSALLCMAASPAAPGPCRVSVMLGSHHIAPRAHFEERNLGLFMTWCLGPRLELSAGAYRNSFGRTSEALMLSTPILRKGRWRFDAIGGIARYPIDGRHFAFHAGDVVPMAGLQAIYQPRDSRVGAFFQVFPSDGKATAAIVSFGLTFHFGRR